MVNPRVQIACAVLWCLVAAGPIFGFAALKPILVSEGVYENLCEPGSVPCAEQDLKLNLVFTIAAGATNIVALPVGYVLDHQGPRVCGVIGSVVIALGSLALSSGYYMAGYAILALGGPFVFISCFQLANSIPNHSGKVLSMITGAFDTSAALFMIYRVWYQGHSGSPDLKTFFRAYLVVPLFILLCQWLIMPRDSYKSLGALQKLEVEGLDEDGNLPAGTDGRRLTSNRNERTNLINRHSMSLSSRPGLTVRSEDNAPLQGEPSLLHSRPTSRVASVSTSRRKSVLEEYVQEQLEVKTEGVYGIMHHKRVTEQIGSWWFILMLVLTTICMLRINYFVATVNSQERYLVGPGTGPDIAGFFDLALPLGGLVAIPFTGIVLDSISTLTVLKIMLTVSVLTGVLGCFPSPSLNVIGILLLVVYRPFYYTVVSDYCAKVFGFETFGTVYGLIMTTSGVFNMFQSVIDRLTQTYFNMNPIPVNLAMTAFTAASGSALIIYADRQSKARYGIIEAEGHSESAIEEESTSTPYGSI